MISHKPWWMRTCGAGNKKCWSCILSILNKLYPRSPESIQIWNAETSSENQDSIDSQTSTTYPHPLQKPKNCIKDGNRNSSWLHFLPALLTVPRRVTHQWSNIGLPATGNKACAFEAGKASWTFGRKSYAEINQKTFTKLRAFSTDGGFLKINNMTMSSWKVYWNLQL